VCLEKITESAAKKWILSHNQYLIDKSMLKLAAHSNHLLAASRSVKVVCFLLRSMLLPEWCACYATLQHLTHDIIVAVPAQTCTDHLPDVTPALWLWSRQQSHLPSWRTGHVCRHATRHTKHAQARASPLRPCNSDHGVGIPSANTERDGRKGPPAGNKARCNRTNTPHSKAMRRKAKPNQTPQTHTWGASQA
jgi:hypothetical protein